MIPDDRGPAERLSAGATALLPFVLGLFAWEWRNRLRGRM
jgi:hypothetical protein